jgi:hypothetical protein
MLADRETIDDGTPRAAETGHDVWVRTPAELAALADRLRATPLVAIDTEADSLHHYPGKLCLVQIADGDGRVV